MSDTLADMITRIRNGQKANKVSVKAIFSKLNVNVCSVLKSEGFIDSYEVIGDNKKDIQITLKYYKGSPLINKIEKISKEKFTFDYNLSEILFNKDQNISLEEQSKMILESIEINGFENTANLYSISDSSKVGGKIGWIKKNNLSSEINSELDNLEVNSFSSPIKIGNNYLILKINEIKKIPDEIKKVNTEINLNKDKKITNEVNLQENTKIASSIINEEKEKKPVDNEIKQIINDILEAKNKKSFKEKVKIDDGESYKKENIKQKVEISEEKFMSLDERENALAELIIDMELLHLKTLK